MLSSSTIILMYKGLEYVERVFVAESLFFNAQSEVVRLCKQFIIFLLLSFLLPFLYFSFPWRIFGYPRGVQVYFVVGFGGVP